MLSTMSKAYGAARLAHMRTQNFVMPRKQPAPSQATPATPTVRIAARKQAPARLFPPRDTPRSPTRQSSQPAPHPARLRVNTAPSATRFLLHRKRFPRRDTVGMRARSRPLRLVKMPVSRPTPARSATRPKPKQSMLPVILPLKFPRSPQPAPRLVIKPAKNARSAARLSPAWRKFPQRDTNGMRARSRPLRPVKMPVSRPTPARFATKPKQKQSLLPVILPLKFPRSPQPAPRLVIKPAKNARSAARLSPAWRKFPRRAIPRSLIRLLSRPAPNPARPRASTAPFATRSSLHRRSSLPRDTPRSSTRQLNPPAPSPARPRASTAPSAMRFLLHRKLPLPRGIRK